MMTRYFRNYSAPPTQPFALPISSHPPTAPCGPGAKLAEGTFVSRGGVFEGAAMSRGQDHCGYWSDYVGDVPLQGRSYEGGRAAVRPVPLWPPETPAHFAPRAQNLGYPAGGGPSRAMAGADIEQMVPMTTTINRTRRIWAGPGGAQSSWPAGMTPRGGVLDGNALSDQPQNVHAAFYTGDSARVLRPAGDVSILPNPIRRVPVPDQGWGIGPAQQRRNFGAQEAERPISLSNRHGAGANQAATVRRLGPDTSPCGMSGAGPDGLGCGGLGAMSSRPFSRSRPPVASRAAMTRQQNFLVLYSVSLPGPGGHPPVAAQSIYQGHDKNQAITAARQQMNSRSRVAGLESVAVLERGSTVCRSTREPGYRWKAVPGYVSCAQFPYQA